MRQPTEPPLLAEPLEKMIGDCRRQDIAAQEKLYRHCYPLMIKICLRYAGDLDGAGIIFNNAMLRVFRHISSYSDQGKFMGWIKTIVVSCAIDFIKQKTAFHNITSPVLPTESAVSREDPLGRVTVKEIQQFIKALPAATAAVFNLFVYEGFSHPQIAQSLGISEGTSRWHVSEGRRLLKAKLSHYFNA